MEMWTDDRQRRRRPEPARAMADEDLPLDHQVEEALVALSALAELLSTHPSRGESCP
jgi:hypothetical protein